MDVPCGRGWTMPFSSVGGTSEKVVCWFSSFNPSALEIPVHVRPVIFPLQVPVKLPVPVSEMHAALAMDDPEAEISVLHGSDDAASEPALAQDDASSKLSAKLSAREVLS